MLDASAVKLFKYWNNYNRSGTFVPDRVFIGEKIVRVLALFSLLLALAVPAQAEKDPKVLVKSVADVVLSEILANKEKLEQGPSFLMGLVETHMLPIIDEERMTMMVLGDQWKAMNSDQQKSFVEGFKRLMVKTYAGAFKAYNGQEVTYGDTRFNKTGSKAIVYSAIQMPGGTPVELQYRLYQAKPDTWLVYDANLAGLGVLKTYRVQFAEQIQRDGLDKTIADLMNIEL